MSKISPDTNLLTVECAQSNNTTNINGKGFENIYTHALTPHEHENQVVHQNKTKSDNEMSLTIYDLLKHICDIQGATPMHYAFRYGESEMFKVIFHHPKFNNNILTDEGLIEVAAAYGHLDIVIKYLKNVSAQDNRNDAIHQFILAAVRFHGKSILSHFADMTGNVSSRLYWVCRQPHGDRLIRDEEYAKTLITKETMSHQYEDDDHFTPLMIAVKYRRVKCIEKLVDSEFCERKVWNKCSRELKKTVFHICAEIQDNEITGLLLDAAKKNNIDVIDSDIMGNTPLHICAQVGDIDILKLLCRDGIDVNSCNINDYTPLHEVARGTDPDEEENKNRCKCVELLVKQRADLNATTILGESPWMIAGQYGSESLVKCILEFRPDILLRNVRHHNGLELAIRQKNENVVKYLIESEHLFPLMRNAQLNNNPCSEKDSRNLYSGEDPLTSCCTRLDCCKRPCFWRCCKSRNADTPMRKLIISMPDMAYKVLDRCTTILGADGTKLHQQIFNYELLEDQFAIYKWIKGKEITCNR
ncbi:unnamed protein product [Rotaria sp. Silwood2]|nr:unnamed protein product [Rotaria sp. Silwood2]